MIIGLPWSCIGFGGFVLWGLLASLDRAAVADGTVVVDSNKKSVQHLEGGIIKELLVRDGDQVKAGDVLLRLDPTQVQVADQPAAYGALFAPARIARLTAEAGRPAPDHLSRPELLACRSSRR